MTISDLSRILHGSRVKNYEDVIYQRQTEHLDAEANLVQKVQSEKLKDVLRHIVKIDSGFSTKTSFSTPGANSFYMGVNSGDVNRVLVNGNIIDIAGTNSPNDYQNQVVLPNAPIGSSRTDFVWLEVWVSEILPDKSFADGISKPTKDTIYKYGNILFGGTNLDDEIEDVSFGSKTANRAQIQYEIRVAEDSTGFVSPNVLAKDGVHSFSPATDPISGEGLVGLWIAQNDNQMFGRFEVDENNNPLGYGYHFAIPICTILRDDSEIAVTLSNISDQRQAIGVNFLDPDTDYTVHGLIIQNNDSDATLVINSNNPSDKSRIVLKRGGLVVGTIEAFATDRIGFGNQSEVEFISLNTADDELGINTTTTNARVHIYEDEPKRPLYIENNNTEISVDVETLQTNTQALKLRNESGLTTTSFFSIEESGTENFAVDSNGLISTRAGILTSLANHMQISADGSSELRLGLSGGGDIVFYDGSDVEIARYDDSANTFEFGKNNSDVTYGGGFGSTGLTIEPNGNLSTDGIINVINSNGVQISNGTVGNTDGFLYLGTVSGSYANYLRYNSSSDRFEFNKPLLFTGSVPIITNEIQVDYISAYTNTPGDPISVDGEITIEGYTGKKLILKSHASDAETHVFEVQNSVGSPVAYIDEDGDLTVNDLHVNGTETVGAVSTITSTSITTDDLIVNDDTTLGNAVGDTTTVNGTFGVRSTTSDTYWNMLINSTSEGVAINRTATLDPATNNNMYLVADGNIGSLYRNPGNTLPRIWVGELFSNTNPIYGGMEWKNTKLFIRSKNGASLADLTFDVNNVGINNAEYVPQAKLDVEGNIYISNQSATTADRELRFRNYNAANSDARLRYIATTNKLYIERADLPTPLMTYDIDVAKVGINQINPDTTLHVQKQSAGTVTSMVDSVVSIENSTHAYLQFLTPNTSFSGIAFGDVDDNDIGYIRYDNSNDSLDFWVNTLERLSINSSGQVGIGKYNHDRQLYLYRDDSSAISSITVEQDGTGDASLRFLLTGARTWGVGVDNSDLDKFKIGISEDWSSGAAFTSDSNQWVGINRTDPSLRFEVSGYREYPSTTGTTRNGIVSLSHDSTGTNVMNFGLAPSSPFGAWIQVQDKAALGTYYPLLLNPNGGNVGLGINAPQNILHLNKADSSSAYIQFTNSTTGTTSTDGGIVGLDSTENLVIGTYEAKSIDFYTNGLGASRMSIDSSGNVTINPGNFVVSSGNITASVGNIITSNQFKSTVASGTKPIDVISTTLCDNLNADLLDGRHESVFAGIGDTESISGSWTYFSRPAFNGGSISASPFTVASSFVVTNLNADLLDGRHESVFAGIGDTETINGSWTFSSRPAFNGGTSGVSSPFTVDSTFKVTNLNADLLDGYTADDFAVRSEGETINGSWTFSSRPAFNGGTSGVSSPFTVDSTQVVSSLNADLLDGYHAGNGSGNIPISNGTVNTNLNADLLDGQHASSFLGASSKAVDSELLDGINSTQFLRSDVDDSASGQITISKNQSNDATLLVQNNNVPASGSNVKSVGIHSYTSSKATLIPAFGLANRPYSIGIVGQSNSNISGTYSYDIGVHGQSTGSVRDSAGISGYATANTIAYGGYFLSENTPYSYGVNGQALNGSVENYGGWFRATSSASGKNYGVYCEADNSTNQNYALYANGGTTPNIDWAAYFLGKVEINGDIVLSQTEYALVNDKLAIVIDKTQSAITNAIATVGIGGTVLLTPGIYGITSKIVINTDEITLKGMGPSNTIITASNNLPAYGMIEILKNNVTIMDLGFHDGGYDIRTGATNKVFIYAYSSAQNLEGTVIQNCNFYLKRNASSSDYAVALLVDKGATYQAFYNVIKSCTIYQIPNNSSFLFIQLGGGASGAHNVQHSNQGWGNVNTTTLPF